MHCVYPSLCSRKVLCKPFFFFITLYIHFYLLIHSLTPDTRGALKDTARCTQGACKVASLSFA